MTSRRRFLELTAAALAGSPAGWPTAFAQGTQGYPNRPVRLVVPFRYGNRSIKAITEILFGTPSLPAPPTA